MTDAEKREKVIQGLKLCAYDPDPGQELKEIRSCPECPYYRAGCSPQLICDALALLKEQEPRVLSKSEAEQYVTHGITDGYSETPPLYVEYQKPQRYYLKWVTLETAYSWMTDYGTSSVYESELRFWTSRPTPEQMRETKWEDEDAE